MKDQRNKAVVRPSATGGPGRQQRGVDPRVKDRKWPGTWMALGIFIGLFSILYVGHRTIVDLAYLVRALLFFSAVGAVLPYAWSGLRMGMERSEWVFFNLLAVGPITMSILLWMNFLVHGPVHCTDQRLLTEGVMAIDDGANGVRTVTIPYGEGWIPMLGPEEGAVGYRLCMARGCLGYWTVVERRRYTAAEVTGADR